MLLLLGFLPLAGSFAVAAGRAPPLLPLLLLLLLLLPLLLLISPLPVAVGCPTPRLSVMLVAMEGAQGQGCRMVFAPHAQMLLLLLLLLLLLRLIPPLPA